MPVCAGKALHLTTLSELDNIQRKALKIIGINEATARTQLSIPSLLLLLLLKYSPPSGVFRTVWLVSVACMVHKKIARLCALLVRVKNSSSH